MLMPWLTNAINFYFHTFSFHFPDILENKLHKEWKPETDRKVSQSLYVEHAYSVQYDPVSLMAHLMTIYDLWKLLKAEISHKAIMNCD
jgi:hypothetical protein